MQLYRDTTIKYNKKNKNIEISSTDVYGDKYTKIVDSDLLVIGLVGGGGGGGYMDCGGGGGGAAAILLLDMTNSPNDGLILAPGAKGISGANRDDRNATSGGNTSLRYYRDPQNSITLYSVGGGSGGPQTSDTNKKLGGDGGSTFTYSAGSTFKNPENSTNQPMAVVLYTSNGGNGGDAKADGNGNLASLSKTAINQNGKINILSCDGTKSDFDKFNINVNTTVRECCIFNGYVGTKFYSGAGGSSLFGPGSGGGSADNSGTIISTTKAFCGGGGAGGLTNLPATDGASGCCLIFNKLA